MPEYIDREVLLKKIFPLGVLTDLRYTINAQAVKYAIDGCKKADVQEVKHGYWYNVYMSSSSSFVGTCSECQRTNDIPPPEQAHYCISCGAKMDAKNER